MDNSADFLHSTFFEREKNEMAKMYLSLDSHQRGFATLNDLAEALKVNHGLEPQTNPELKEILINLLHKNGKQQQLEHTLSWQSQLDTCKFEFEDFLALMDKEKENVIQKAFAKKLAVPDWQQFCNDLHTLFEEVRGNTTGKNADYIPQLAEVDPDLYSMSVCTVDGQQFHLGDAEFDFTIQSCSKVFTYCIACQDMGIENVHKFVGCEPSGVAFNAFTLDENKKPHNPMINAGAITVCSLVAPQMKSSKRFKYISDKLCDFAGGAKIGFDNATYLSEKDTADKNFALSYYMKENKVFDAQSNLEDTTDLYFQACSILVSSKKLSFMAATLANAGVCPLTDKTIISPDVVKSSLQLMLSCGMYDFSGEWSCTVGLPSKSGVAGAVFVVIPKVMGICIFSPRLDARGNSVRGIDFCTRASRKFKWSIFDRLVMDSEEDDKAEEINDSIVENNTQLNVSNNNAFVEKLHEKTASPDLDDAQSRKRKREETTAFTPPGNLQKKARFQ